MRRTYIAACVVGLLGACGGTDEDLGGLGNESAAVAQCVDTGSTIVGSAGSEGAACAAAQAQVSSRCSALGGPSCSSSCDCSVGTCVPAPVFLGGGVWCTWTCAVAVECLLDPAGSGNTVPVPCTLKRPGERCWSNGECCSGICRSAGLRMASYCA